MAIIVVHAHAEIAYLLEQKGMIHPKPNMPIMYMALCEPHVLLHQRHVASSRRTCMPLLDIISSNTIV